MATLNAGTGLDGNATVSADKNISTESLVGRGYADMVPYQCSSVGSDSCVTSATPNGIVSGDEVLLINWQGTSSNYEQVGNYETFIVDNVNSNTITFTTDKTKFFGDTSGTDICTGGTATASAYTGANVASRAFDDNTGTFWQVQSATAWLKYELSSAKIVVKYSVQNHTFTNQTPKVWTFEGSNNDSDWTVLDTVTGQTGWTSTQTRTFRCDTTGEFLYYRLNFTEANGSNDEIILSDIDMYDATDTNIGTGGSNQRVRVQRVPQYNNLTIDNGYTLTANDAWDTGTGGILFLRAAGTILVNGSIDMTGKGYAGGYSNYSNPNWYVRTGASYHRNHIAVTWGTSYFLTPNKGGGARGGYNGSIWATGAGAGYGTTGLAGMSHNWDGNNYNEYRLGSGGGETYGEPTLAKLFLGCGGGSGDENWVKQADTYADGGGIIALFATTLDIYGSISNNGTPGVAGQTSNWPGGAGSGGSILIHAGTLYTRSSTFTAIGATGVKSVQPYYCYGGDGGDGRIAIHYAALGDNIASVDPVPYTDSGLQLPYKIEGIVSDDCSIRVYDSSWGFVKTHAATTGSYEISNLPNAGPFYVIADPTASGTNIAGYKGVVPTQ